MLCKRWHEYVSSGSQQPCQALSLARNIIVCLSICPKTLYCGFSLLKWLVGWPALVSSHPGPIALLSLRSIRFFPQSSSVDVLVLSWFVVMMGARAAQQLRLSTVPAAIHAIIEVASETWPGHVM